MHTLKRTFLRELNSISVTSLAAKNTRCLPGLRLYKRRSFPEGVNKVKRNLYGWKTLKSACFVSRPAGYFCRSCHTNGKRCFEPSGSQGVEWPRGFKKRAGSEEGKQWLRLEKEDGGWKSVILCLNLTATYTHAPSCRNWTRIGTQLDSVTLAIAQPNGPKLQPVTQTSPWWEDRRLPGERFEPPRRSHDQRHSIDWLKVQAALPFSGHSFTDERERGSHTGAGRILRGFGGGLSR